MDSEYYREGEYLGLEGEIREALDPGPYRWTRVRFPCKHGYWKPHFGEGGRLENLRKRGASWCRGGEWRLLREVHPSRVALLSDDHARYRVYVEKV